MAKDKNPAAVAMGRLGGLKGGRARADKLSPGERSRIAAKAARFRWHIETVDDALEHLHRRREIEIVDQGGDPEDLLFRLIDGGRK